MTRPGPGQRTTSNHTGCRCWVCRFKSTVAVDSPHHIETAVRSLPGLAFSSPGIRQSRSGAVPTFSSLGGHDEGAVRGWR